MARTKVPISRHALTQRLNRALAKEDRQLKKSRGERARQDCGEYYVLDTTGNYIVEKDVDLETLGREWEVLQEWEELVEDEG